jgi:hypothetical protein
VSSQGDQCADADPRQIGTDRLGWDYKVRCRLPHRTPSSVGQLDRDVTGTAPGTLAKNHKSLTKKGMPRVGDRDVRHYPINNWGILRCSVIRWWRLPSSIACFTTAT